jgi:hypothetical protein
MATATFLPGTLDLEIYQGDSLILPIDILDSENQAIDLTDSTITMQVRSAEDNTVLLELDNDGEGSITITSTGISIERDFTQNEIPAGVHKYDIEVNFTTGRRRTYVKGNLTIQADVTE